MKVTNILLVGFDEKVSVETIRLLPKFINCASVERKDFPKNIGNEKPEIVFFNLTAPKSEGFKMRPFIEVINKENNLKNHIPFQIFIVSDKSGAEDLHFMLSSMPGITYSVLLGDARDLDEVGLFGLIMEKFYERKGSK